jgi:hypothetical protein
MPAAKPAPVPVLAAATRESAVVGAVSADLRAAGRQLDALVREVRRLQGLIDELQAGRT